jgi:phosphoribosyl 1,2-cyclic phosphate phosphodiesterase
MSDMTLTFLGTGTSHGVPVIGCDCQVCTSADPKDRRYRSSVLFTKGENTLLIDTTPEFRLQALRANVSSLDGVLYTHDHADHFNGIDDLRVFCRNGALSIYTSEAVKQVIEQRFSYVLNGDDVGIPHLEVVPLQPYAEVVIGPFHVTAIPILHGRRMIYGFRVGEVAYLTDCSEVPAESLPYLEDLDVLVVGALRHSPHPNHYSVYEARALAAKVGSKRTYLTHISHRLSHQQLQDELPPLFFVAYDGLRVTVKEQP